MACGPHPTGWLLPPQTRRPFHQGTSCRPAAGQIRPLLAAGRTSRAPCSGKAGTEKNGRPFVRWPERRPDKSGPAQTAQTAQTGPARSPSASRVLLASSWAAGGSNAGRDPHPLAATRWPRPGPHGGPAPAGLGRAGQSRSCCCRAATRGSQPSANALALALASPAARQVGLLRQCHGHRQRPHGDAPACMPSMHAPACPQHACLSPQRHYLSVQHPEAAGMMWREWRMMRGPPLTLSSPTRRG